MELIDNMENDLREVFTAIARGESLPPDDGPRPARQNVRASAMAEIPAGSTVDEAMYLTFEAILKVLKDAADSEDIK